MAPFNKRQIGYIKAIADVGGHTTYKAQTLNGVPNLAALASTTTHDGFGKYAMVCFSEPPQVWDAGTSNSTDRLDASRDYVHTHNVYDVPVNTDETAVTVQQRVTPECYLESVNTRMRLIQTLDVSDNTKSHQEYRLLVFRHKEKQHIDPHFAENFSNPLYDLFVSTANYKYGPKGYREKPILNSGSNDYVNFSSTANDTQSLLTNMVNKEDYVFMKDCRFYLGKEYGGKHIYEDKFHWNHADPIATEASDLTANESNNKNYAWMMMLVCTTNGPSVVPDFPYVRLDSTTHVTSG